MRPWIYCGWFFENISAVLTGGQKGKERMSVVEQNIVKAIKITQKGNSAVWGMEVDVSMLCVALIKLSQTGNKIIGRGRGLLEL